MSIFYARFIIIFSLTPVGSALRNNPFAPFIPCHRIIASNNFIGGFLGEWNKQGQRKEWGENTRKKIEMLAKEGVGFDEKGFLISGESKLWRGPDAHKASY